MAAGPDARFRTRPRAGAAALALAALLCAGCLHARGTADEPVVTKVKFEGVKAVDASELEEKLATRASDRLAWGEARKLDPDALAFDRRRIVAFYKERGYYRAAVEDAAVVPDGEGRVRVTFRVREGEPVRVTRLDVLGLESAPEALARAGKLSLRPGQVFTWAAFDAARAELQSALGETGYVTGKVTQAAVVRGEEKTAEVTYRVDAGPRYRFGSVEVSGTVAVPEDKVAAQAARLVRTGDWFDERRLDRVQARVYELGVFGGVRVNHGTPDPDGGAVPVVVSVREAPFHTLRLGPGLGFESTRWEVVGQASWTVRNWLGDLRQLKLDARGGYAWIPDPVAPIRQGFVGSLSAEFTQPGVFHPAVDLATKVELEQSVEQTYDSTSEKIRFGTPFRPAPRWTIVPSYNLEVYQLRDVAVEAENLPEVQNCPGGTCVLSYLEERVTWDRRDHPLLTTEGFFLSLALQEGFPLGGLAYTYLRVLPEARWYTPLGRGTVLAARARLGALMPVRETGAAPVVALFMSGGATSMRGYGAERLSPMVYSEADKEWVPTGGNGLLEASLEVRRTIAGNVIGALFLDGGNVSTASAVPSTYKEVFDLSKFQLALGVGVRYRTSVGPFRADLAIRLPTDFSSGVPFEERFPAVPGDSGHREPIAVFHIALGEAY
jgi:translocation and assembly module TamA